MQKLFLLSFVFMGFALATCNQTPPGTATPSGYRFVNYTNVQGEKVKNGDIVTMHVNTWLQDTMMFSTRKSGDGSPREFTMPEADQLPKRIPPVYEALLMMAVGDSASIYEPLDSTKLSTLPPSLKGRVKEARYDIKVVKVTSGAEFKSKIEGVKAIAVGSLDKFKANDLGANGMALPSGVKVMFSEKGTGAALKAGENVSVNYYGIIADGSGKMFDNSFQRGQPMTFPVSSGQMIKGFDEGIMKFAHGDKGMIFIPYAMGYGEQGGGPIPPKADLIFYIEVL